MPRASLSTNHPAVVDLKSTASSLGELCEDEALDLVKLGKALELIVQHANAVVRASGRTSIRLRGRGTCPRPPNAQIPTRPVFEYGTR